MKPKRDKRGRFVRRKIPPRDSSGRFKKRYVPPRNPDGTFRRDRRKHRKTEAVKRARKILQPPPAKAPGQYDLCQPSERLRFYDDIIKARSQAKIPEEQKSALLVEVNIEGTVKPRKTKSGKKSKRVTTAFIGKRSFGDMRKLKRFLLLDTGEKSGLNNDNPFGLNWSKRGLCQFKKSARLIVPPETRRQRVKTIKTFKLKG